MEDQILFVDRTEFRKWLLKNCAVNSGIWLVFNKSSRLKSVKPDEALEEALCFGWIDGQIKSIDKEKYIKKFTPRRKDSRWSATNRNIATKLIAEHKITDFGLAAIERAKKSGTWDTPGRVPVSDDQIEILVKALQGSEPALTNFLKMPLSVRRTYTGFYLDTKKEETRARRLQYIIGRLNENKKPM